MRTGTIRQPSSLFNDKFINLGPEGTAIHHLPSYQVISLRHLSFISVTQRSWVGTQEKHPARPYGSTKLRTKLSPLLSATSLHLQEITLWQSLRELISSQASYPRDKMLTRSQDLTAVCRSALRRQCLLKCPELPATLTQQALCRLTLQMWPLSGVTTQTPSPDLCLELLCPILPLPLLTLQLSTRTPSLTRRHKELELLPAPPRPSETAVQ